MTHVMSLAEGEVHPVVGCERSRQNRHIREKKPAPCRGASSSALSSLSPLASRFKEEDSVKYIHRYLALGVLAAVAVIPTMGAAQAPKFQQDIIVQGKAMPGSTSDFFLTFSGPFSMPGVSLAQGTYIFRSPSPGLLQVLSADRRATYAMAFTIPVERDVASEGLQVKFGTPVTEGSPQRVIAWWRPEMRSGQQLIYPNR